MTPTKTQAALQYILAHGNLWQQWRALRLSGEKTNDLPPSGWAPAQNVDGGVHRPYNKSGISCVGATSGLLLTATFLGLHNTLEYQKALAYIWANQQLDGRWTENPTPDSNPPPPWFRQGDVKVDLWETANIVSSLAASGFASDPRLHKGVAWAEQYAQADGGFPGFIHTTYGLAAAQYRLGDLTKATEHLRYAQVFLDTNPDIHDLNWGLMLFFVGGIPVDHLTVQAYVNRLVETQGVDGIWSTIYTGNEVPFALEALELLRAYDVW